MDTTSEDKIAVDQRSSAMPGVILICLLVGFFGLVSSVYYPFMLHVTFAILVVMVFFGLFAKTRAGAEIDLSERVALVYSKSFVGRRVASRYPLNEIESVRSYFSSGKNYQIFRVLLVPKDNKPLIEFAQFDATGPLRTRGQIEENGSRLLREEIARKCGLKDEGFVADGWRRKVE